MLNEVVRRGLGAATEQASFVVPTFDSPFRPGVDPQRLNQLVDDLAVDDDLARLAEDRR